MANDLVKRKKLYLADIVEAGPKALTACYNFAAWGLSSLIGNKALKKYGLTAPRKGVTALAFAGAITAGGIGGGQIAIERTLNAMPEARHILTNHVPRWGQTFRGTNYPVVLVSENFSMLSRPYFRNRVAADAEQTLTGARNSGLFYGGLGGALLLMAGFQGAARYRISARRRELDALEAPRQTAALPSADPPKHNPLSLT